MLVEPKCIDYDVTMEEEKSGQSKWYEKITLSVITAYVLGAVVVIPGLLWIMKKFGVSLPQPVENLMKFFQ